jgi:hypothetical protein
LQQPNEIVEITYSIPHNVKPNAQRFNVQSKQIHMWKRQLEAEENSLMVYPAPHSSEELVGIKK